MILAHYSMFKDSTGLYISSCSLWKCTENGEPEEILGYGWLCACILGRVWLFLTPWTVAHQAPLSMEFSRQEYWSGLPFPSPGELPDPGSEPWSPILQEVSCTAGRFFTDWARKEAPLLLQVNIMACLGEMAWAAHFQRTARKWN